MQITELWKWNKKYRIQSIMIVGLFEEISKSKIKFYCMAQQKKPVLKL